MGKRFFPKPHFSDTIDIKHTWTLGFCQTALPKPITSLFANLSVKNQQDYQPLVGTSLALAATNLLDETDYRYTSFGSLSASLYSFTIRPRNIINKLQIKI